MAKSKKTDLEAILKESLDAFALAEDAERDQRERAVEDMLFVDSEDGQWDDNAKKARAGRPMYTIDLTSEALNQIIGDQRQSKTRVKVNPDGSGADVETAKIYDGIIRNIEKQSHAENAYDNSFKESLKGGYGGWRYLTKYNDDDIFKQDIVVRPINSAATSLYFDVDAKEYDKRDADKAWLISEISQASFDTKYPDAKIGDFNSVTYRQGSCKNWFSEKGMRIAEYWKKEPCMKTIALMSNGDTIDLGEAEKVIDELKEKDITIIEQRTVKSHKIVMYKMNGAEILSGPHAWAGKYIPLVPEYGEVSHVEGKTFVRGKVRKVKDAARIYNYTTSAKIESTALTGKDPLMVTDTMIAGHEDDYETLGSANKPVIRFKPDPELQGGVPFRLGAPTMQSALIEQTQQAKGDVHSVIGMHDPALGSGPQLLSEKSMMNQAEMGDRGAFEYKDNLEKSKEYGALILVDLIPKIYDTPQIIQILNMDGSIESHKINQDALDDFGMQVKDEESGDVVKVNDLSKGKYSVSVDTGPTHKTMREETAKQLTELAAASPIFEQLATDLIAKNMNITESEEMTKRIRKQMIKQGLVDPTEDEQKEPWMQQMGQTSADEQALVDNVNMQSEDLKSQIENRDAKTQETLVKTQTETINALKTMLEAYKSQAELGVSFGPQQQANLVTQNDIVADAQDITQEGQPNSEQAADIMQQLQSGQLTEQDLQ